MSQAQILRSSIDPGELPDSSESIVLARRAQNGEASAVGRLFERYQDRLRRIVRIRLGARLRRHIESMDIVQETYEVAFKKIGQLEVHSGAGILHWLARIAEHQIHDANDYFHAQKRDRGRERALEPGSPDQASSGSRQLAADTTPPDERAWKSELREIVDSAMSELSDEHREVILLRDYCGGEWEYVTREVGRPNVHAAQELHRRAWIKLRRIVRPRLEASAPGQ